MDRIIQEIIEKIIKDNTNNLEEFFSEHKDISQYILKTKEMLDEIGTMVVGKALELSDEMVRESAWRKNNWYIQRKNDEKALATLFGEVYYTRTYYKHKTEGTYSYLSDEGLGIYPHQRMDLSMKSELIEKALDLSYKKSGESTARSLTISDQSVMNCIRELGSIENSSAKIAEEKKQVKTLYIEADEDHVPMQDGTNRQLKLVYVHEGRQQVSKNRYKLNNTRYFSGEYNNNSEELWLEVAEYIQEAYDIDNVEKIYLSGDGARWIKEGLNWIKGSHYVLDRFHLSKYIKKATGHIPNLEPILWSYINQLNKDNVKELLETILKRTEKNARQESIKEARRYILNNWDGIERQYEPGYIGCSAEGHVSHILSARLSSRPKGWSRLGADQMARLRAYRANKGKVYDIMIQKQKETQKENRVAKLSKNIIKTKLATISHERIDNITILNIGKRTWAKGFLETMRGA